MKNEVIEKVINHVISEGFSSDQIDIVKNSLIIALNGYVVTKDTTELTVYEGNINERLIKKFLIAKRVTGRTNRTLKCYREYLTRIFRTMNKSCLDVTTDDIRLYLALKESRDGLKKTSLNSELRSAFPPAAIPRICPACTWQQLFRRGFGGRRALQDRRKTR